MIRLILITMLFRCLPDYFSRISDIFEMAVTVWVEQSFSAVSARSAALMEWSGATQADDLAFRIASFSVRGVASSCL